MNKHVFSIFLLVAAFLSVGIFSFSVRAEPTEGVRVSIKKIDTDKFSLYIEADRGMLDWLIFPTEDYLGSERGIFKGLPTGDGINCAKTFGREAVFSEKAFPLRVTVQACKDDGSFVGWGREERTTAVTLFEPGEVVTEKPIGTAGFVTPPLDGSISEAVKECVRKAPDGQAMFNDWQDWTANPNGTMRYKFTLETREIINMCVWRASGVENPFLYPSEGKPPLPDPGALDISYPIPELGNCVSESACRNYCEKPDNPGRMRSCLAFARTHHLLSEEEIAQGEEFADIIEQGGGPGGCTSEQECRAYCEDTVHIDVCLDFAEKHGFLSDEELQEARKVQAALQSGYSLPGGCNNKEKCEAYCAQPAHIRPCVEFAKGAGLMSETELAEVEKFLPLIEKGETPGQCVSKAHCEAYCAGEEHFLECVAFAEKAGVISSKEAEAIKKSGGKTPGGCRSKEQCEVYCDKPEHMDECVHFALQTGLVTQEEMEKIKQEMSEEINAEIEQKINKCISLPCKDGLACLTGLDQEAKTQGMSGGKDALPEPLKGKIEEKIQSCQQELMPKVGEGGIPAETGFSVSPQTVPPSEEEIQKIIESEQQKPAEGQIYELTSEQCQAFAAAPKCEYVGSPDSDAYKYCKQCFPDR